MKTIVIKTQAEWDLLPADTEAVLEIRSTEWITIRSVPGSSRVVARGSSSVHHYGTEPLLLFAFSVAWLYGNSKAVRKSKTAHILKPVKRDGVKAWLDDEGIEAVDGQVTLFKRVSSTFKTQEGTPNETLWTGTVECKKWSPKTEECNAGKFHACSRPYFCDEFRSETGDKYIAIKVAVKDLYAWPVATRKYQHKVAFRRGTVLFECDNFGDKI